jgi:hypothetical protein
VISLGRHEPPKKRHHDFPEAFAQTPRNYTLEFDLLVVEVKLLVSDLEDCFVQGPQITSLI